jgi:hypothetical protein
MIGGETLVVGRVPVLGGGNEPESGLQLVGQRNDEIALRHSQGAPG